MSSAGNSYTFESYGDMIARTFAPFREQLWVWDEDDHVWRNDETGEVLEEEDMVAIRDQLVDWHVDWFARWPPDPEDIPEDESHHNILALLLLGMILLDAWERFMRDAIQDSAVAQYAFGRGGLDNMDEADWEWLAEYLLEQYSYLSGFSRDIAAGLLSEAQIAWRSSLYFSAAVAAFERGRMKGMSESLNLTRHPGDMTSICGVRDRCYWSYADSKDAIHCRWIRTAAESCATCIRRSGCPPVIFMKDTGEHISMECYERDF